MHDPRDFEALFRANLVFIDKALSAAARMLGLRDADSEEFASWAREQLWENDYAILRKWREQSKLTTYLGTVIVNLGREFRVRRWGRWRHSAAAERLGPLALRLEQLIYRDGWRFAEAAELLRSRQETDRSDRELAALMSKIPHREAPRRQTRETTDTEAVHNVAETGDPLDEMESESEMRSVRAQLARALSRLKPTAQIVIRMHFLSGRSLADVARALGTAQKPLYRMKDDALRLLKRDLESSGVTWDQLRDLIGGALEDVSREEERNEPQDEAQKGSKAGDISEPRPSNELCDSTPSGAPGPLDADRDRTKPHAL